MRRSFAIICVVWGLTGCESDLPPSQTVIVDIAGKPVTRAELDAFVEASAQQEASFLQGDVMAGLFEQFIEEQLLLKAADDDGITVEPSAVARRMKAIRTAEPASSPIGVADDAVFARSLANQLRIERLVSRVLGDLRVAEDEIAAHYEANRAYYERPETLDVSQILVAEEELAQAIRKELAANPSRFEELASEHSIGPEASGGGRLGSFARGELPPSFEAEVFALSPGGISEVVATDFGFHIFRVNHKEASEPLELDEVDNAIRVELLRKKSDDAMELYIENLKERYPVTVYREHLSFAFLDWEEVRAR